MQPAILAVSFFSSRGPVADNFYTLCRALAPLAMETARARHAAAEQAFRAAARSFSSHLRAASLLEAMAQGRFDRRPAR